MIEEQNFVDDRPQSAQTSCDQTARPSSRRTNCGFNYQRIENVMSEIETKCDDDGAEN